MVREGRKKGDDAWEALLVMDRFSGFTSLSEGYVGHLICRKVRECGISMYVELTLDNSLLTMSLEKIALEVSNP